METRCYLVHDFGSQQVVCLWVVGHVVNLHGAKVLQAHSHPSRARTQADEEGG